ncbi:MAG: DJ-1/PfpI family protein [Nitrospirae bacterium]|nr:MAG: DJ-1/PfpI family protein [Nitrospirota bacterium]
MSKRVLLLLAEGFEEVEALTPLDILRRGGIEVVTCGLAEGPVTSAHGLKVLPDTHLDQVAGEDFDLVLLPGGAPGYLNLAKDPRVLELVRHQLQATRPVAAICGAPYVLEEAGVLAGRKVTAYPSVRERLASAAEVSDETVVRDGPLRTSQGVGTAMEFALALLEELAGPEVRHRVAKATLVER